MAHKFICPTQTLGLLSGPLYPVGYSTFVLNIFIFQYIQNLIEATTLKKRKKKENKTEVYFRISYVTERAILSKKVAYTRHRELIPALTLLISNLTPPPTFPKIKPM